MTGSTLIRDDEQCHVTNDVQFLSTIRETRSKPILNINKADILTWNVRLAAKCRSSPTSFAFGSSGAWASFVCLMFSTIFLRNEWLLFSFFVISTSNMNHKHLVKIRVGQRQEAKRVRSNHFTPLQMRRGGTTGPTQSSKRASFYSLGTDMLVWNSLFDVSELFKVLRFGKIRVMRQQVDHIRHHVLRQKGQELLWRTERKEEKTRSLFTSFLFPKYPPRPTQGIRSTRRVALLK